MMTELFIENQKADLSAEMSALLTFQLDDIKDFASRNTTFSKTIVLAGTARNNALFGHIFDVRISNPYDASSANVLTNFNASVSAECLIFHNHIQTFKGTLRLLEIVVENGVPEYEVAVFGELGSLVAKIGNKKLDDLDFSAYDMYWNASGVTNSWNASGGTGVLFPLIDYGTVSDINNPLQNKIHYDIRAFRPALYVKEYIDKIITGAGYKYESALMETERFRRLVVPYNQKELRTVQSDLVRVTRNAIFGVINSLSPTAGTFRFETFTGTGFTANANKDEFTYTEPSQAVLKIKFSIFGYYRAFDNGALNALFTVRINNIPISGYSKTISDYTLNNNYKTFIWEYELDATFNQNDVLSFYAENINGVPNWEVEWKNSYFTIKSITGLYTIANYNAFLTINNAIPKEILQKDFLSSVVKLFNLYIYEDNFNSKKLYIKPYVDFYDLNVSGITDWTFKLDRSKVIKLKPMSELNSRYYNFIFKKDSDYWADLYRNRYNEGYGDRVYDSGFEFTNEKTDIQLIFSASVLVGYSGKDKIVSALYKKTAGIEETMDTNIRIMQTKKITGVASWSIKNDTTILSSQTSYGYAGHYDDPDAPANDIHFGVPKELFFTLVSGSINVTQFNVYWSVYMAEITDKDSKLMTASFKLTVKDIFDLDFSKLKFIDGALWRLNKIEDWNASAPDICKAELIKVINLIY